MVVAVRVVVTKKTLMSFSSFVWSFVGVCSVSTAGEPSSFKAALIQLGQLGQEQASKML
jgi:hypothetical protein